MIFPCPAPFLNDVMSISNNEPVVNRKVSSVRINFQVRYIAAGMQLLLTR
ncbi:MAG: hypothetical protein WDA47_04590 [Bacilli bacterium]